MSAYEVVRRAAEEAAQRAELTGRRDERVAARHLHHLADRLEREATLDRELKRRAKGVPEERQRRRSPAESGPLTGPRRRPAERWATVGGDHESTVHLRKVGRRKSAS